MLAKVDNVGPQHPAASRTNRDGHALHVRHVGVAVGGDLGIGVAVGKPGVCSVEPDEDLGQIPAMIVLNAANDPPVPVQFGDIAASCEGVKAIRVLCDHPGQ